MAGAKVDTMSNLNEAFEKWADSKEANRVTPDHQNSMPVREIARRAFVAGSEYMRGKMLSIVEAEERDVLASEGEGREWVGIHNLLLRLHNEGTK